MKVEQVQFQQLGGFLLLTLHYQVTFAASWGESYIIPLEESLHEIALNLQIQCVAYILVCLQHAYPLNIFTSSWYLDLVRHKIPLT